MCSSRALPIERHSFSTAHVLNVQKAHHTSGHASALGGGSRQANRHVRCGQLSESFAPSACTGPSCSRACALAERAAPQHRAAQHAARNSAAGHASLHVHPGHAAHMAAHSPGLARGTFEWRLDAVIGADDVAQPPPPRGVLHGCTLHGACISNTSTRRRGAQILKQAVEQAAGPSTPARPAAAATRAAACPAAALEQCAGGTHIHVPRVWHKAHGPRCLLLLLVTIALASRHAEEPGGRPRVGATGGGEGACRGELVLWRASNQAAAASKRRDPLMAHDGSQEHTLKSVTSVRYCCAQECNISTLLLCTSNGSAPPPGAPEQAKNSALSLSLVWTGAA